MEKDYKSLLDKFVGSDKSLPSFESVIEQAKKKQNSAIKNERDIKNLPSILSKMLEHQKLDLVHINMCFTKCITHFKEVAKSKVIQNKEIHTIVEAILAVAEEANLKPNLETYNKLLTLYALKEEADLASILFEEIQSRGIKPDIVTYSIMIQLYKKCGEYSKATSLFNNMHKYDITADTQLFNTILDVYVQQRDIESVWYIIDKMEKQNISKDTCTYNILIKIYAELNEVKNALVCFEEMKRQNITPDQVSYHTLMNMFAKLKQEEETLILFEEMKKNKCKISITTYNILFSLYRDTGNQEAFQALESQVKKESLTKTIITYSILVDFYCKRNDEEQVDAIIDKMKQNNIKPDHVIYNTIITMYKRREEYSRVIELYKKLERTQECKLDKAIHNNVMEVAAILGERKTLDEIYDKAKKEKNNKKKMLNITNSYIDGLFVLCKKKKLAIKDFYHLAVAEYQKYIAEFFQEKGYIIDCHGMSPGAFAVLLLQKYNNNTLNQYSFNIGKGVHSKGSEDHRLSAVPEQLTNLKLIQGIQTQKNGKYMRFNLMNVY